jgi:hypothetical protein
MRSPVIEVIWKALENVLRADPKAYTLASIVSLWIGKGIQR